MYWLDDVEIDFIYDKTALQVTATDKIPARETMAFDKFKIKNKEFNEIVITSTIKTKKDTISFIPIKEFIDE